MWYLVTETALKKMFYLHIPKTGGQTLATRLASAYRPDKCCFLARDLNYPRDIEELDKLSATKDFIEAHVGGEMLRNRNNLDILVTVREPISQLISNYRHIRREPTSLWYRPATELSAELFFDNFGDFFANHQNSLSSLCLCCVGSRDRAWRLHADTAYASIYGCRQNSMARAH